MISFFTVLGRHIKSAFLSLFRHVAMTISSSSAVTVTLILFAAFLLLAGNISKFTGNIESDFRIHVVLNQDQMQQEQFDSMHSQLLALEHVEKAEFSSKDQELELYKKEKPLRCIAGTARLVMRFS